MKELVTAHMTEALGHSGGGRSGEEEGEEVGGMLEEVLGSLVLQAGE